MNSSEYPTITMHNTNVFTMYLHVTKIHMLVHRSSVIYHNTKMVLIFREKDTKTIYQNTEMF